MKKYLLTALVLFAAVPCGAEIKDIAAARAALGSAAARERLEAIQYLAAERSDPAFEALSAHFPSEKDAYLRVQIVEALDVAGSTWAFACAQNAAGDQNQAVRQAAAAAVAQRAGDPEADNKLKTLAADPQEPVRLTVVNSLSYQPGPSAAAIVGGMLEDKKETLRARRAAAKALSRMKTREADKELAKHLADSDPEIKASAASRKPAKKSAAKPAAKPAVKPAAKKTAPASGKPAQKLPAKKK